MFGKFGIWEILLVLVIILLFFGPSRLPQLARSLRQTATELRSSVAKDSDDEEDL